MDEAKRPKAENVDLIVKSTWLALNRMFSEQAQNMDATVVQGLALLKIDPKNGTRSTNLGPKMAIEPTSLTRIVKLLADEGYIYKDKSGADKREVILKLTPKGLHHRDLSKKFVMDFNRMVAERIPQDKLEIFKEVMTEIQKVATEINRNNK